MTRILVSLAIVACMALVGCDKSDDATKSVEKAADKTASEASDAMGSVKDSVDKGVEQAKDTTAAGMEQLQKEIDDLIAKAKAAVNSKNWNEAESYISQIKSLQKKLPQEAQDKITASLAEVQKLIDAGKQLAPK